MSTARLKFVVFGAAIAATSSAFAQSTIKIGVQAPITGEYAAEGQGIENAVKLIASQVNSAGGTLGRKLEIVTCDDEGKAAQAAICARKLVNEGVLAVIGSYTSGATLAAAPIYTSANVIVTSDASSDDLTQRGYKTFFRNAPPNNAEAGFTADYLVRHKKYKRIAVLSDHSSFSSGLGDGVAKAIKANNGNVVFTGFITAGSQDYTPILTKIKSENPDVLYFSGYYSDGGLIRAQMVQLGLPAVFVGGDANQNTSFAKIAGKAAEGAVIINTPDPESLPYPIAKEFLAQYKDTYKSTPPSVYTFSNADGLRIILAAVTATKSTDSTKLVDWMHNMKSFDGLTGRFGFDEKGERVGSPFAAAEMTATAQYRTVYPLDQTAKN
ncbi:MULTISPECIES: branched-chain amino acid ABC transporter substrate-binding protein [Paraburkholderia]|uniref:branched-chain amino acid ABC transporter substrate-binding protein n=1 Tax=Paraburkholderia TaxID=1822464 RepID=UPI002AB64061|nr:MULTISPECIES: branched-chain amino acid ABC transporter substrate-binding protein [Paraburkholderia]